MPCPWRWVKNTPSRCSAGLQRSWRAWRTCLGCKLRRLSPRRQQPPRPWQPRMRPGTSRRHMALWAAQGRKSCGACRPLQAWSRLGQAGCPPAGTCLCGLGPSVSAAAAPPWARPRCSACARRRWRAGWWTRAPACRCGMLCMLSPFAVSSTGPRPGRRKRRQPGAIWPSTAQEMPPTAGQGHGSAGSASSYLQ